MKIHPMARTAPQIRAEIRNSPLFQREKARRYNVSRATLRKWEKRDDVQDRSHRPHRMATSLTEAQEIILLEIRNMLLLPLDDLLVVARNFIKAEMTRSSLYRLLKRHKAPSLRELVRQNSAEDSPEKSFKDYEPGFLHVDIKYLPRRPDEICHRYLFVAIDRATRWVFFKVYAYQTQDRQWHAIHRSFPQTRQESQRHASLRPGMRPKQDRTPPDSAAPSSNQRHGRALE
jgi:transposase-like protein